MTTIVVHPSIDERTDRGRAACEQVSPSAHAGWAPAAGRPDPVALLEEQDSTREPDLVPVRHGRMLVSPFTFYRGAARIMATDLKDTPTAGLDVQLCGDAHLSNFGAFASPERTLIFGLNDFDETLPGPFEYDVKRMAASFTIAGRNNGFSRSDARAATLESVSSYRAQMAEFAEMRTLDIWYAHLSEQELLGGAKAAARAARQSAGKDAARTAAKSAEKQARKAHTRDSLQALSKLAERVDGRYRIVSQPPVVVPLRELAPRIGLSVDELEHVIHEQFQAYRETLQDDRRLLLERFEIVDMAHKVVGVGSVGTRAFIVLLQGRDQDDPLFLQVKEATASVLEDHLPKSRYQPSRRTGGPRPTTHAARERHLPGLDESPRCESLPLLAPAARHEGFGPRRDHDPGGTDVLRATCGRTLALAHARSGDPVALAAYMGKKDRFERSITDFSERYADQNERDYQAFAEAIRSGRLAAIENV